MRLIKELFKLYLLFALIFFLGRLTLWIIYFDRFEDISFFESLLSFVYGLRMDTIVISIVLVIPTIFLAISPQIFSKYIAKGMKWYFALWLLIFVFIENATIPFFAQYDVRPNYLFLAYLEYPKEVISLMFKDYLLELIISFVMMGALGYWFIKSRLFDFENAMQTRYIYRLLMLLPLLVVLFIGIRSSFGHRGVNISDAMYSTNRIINEITKSSLHAIGYAAYSNSKNSTDLVKQYGKMALEDAYEIAKETLNIEFDDMSRPFYREAPTHFKSENPKNLVIFIQESMGSQFVEFSGGRKDLTPNMNKLGREYLAFSDLYSNGTRSIRGLCGLSAGFLAMPGEGILKRTKSQSDFFNVASLLKPYGYKSSFIYGGEGRFDNMKSWYLGNGFDEVIEQKDFNKPTFESTWGVCDEDLVIEANKQFKQHAMKGEKFVSVMFSQSNHAPFELPKNKIEFVEGVPEQSVENAIKYADFAIGRFFELAKEEEYYKDTVFVVVADHNIRVHGDERLPVSMFQIPAVIVVDGMLPQMYDEIATQPDVLATAIDLIGIDLAYPILGHSIYSDTKTDVSLMQFNDTYALRKGGKVAILEPNIAPQTYIYENKKLILAPKDEALEQAALALIVILEDLYDKKLYK
ncbi:MAG: LTA synthase family protein [Sulfurimonadaceae bacterium]|jgi:phosphoglycerol transferase MdoB-like AlkP superfamily enzyme|nr:LTA synthase family protein [Sulfurimonadaceae bacterium]